MGRTACTGPQCLYKRALYIYLIHYKRGCESSQQTKSSVFIDLLCDVIEIVPRGESLNNSGFIFFPGRLIRIGTARKNRVLTANHSDVLASICRN